MHRAGLGDGPVPLQCGTVVGLMLLVRHLTRLLGAVLVHWPLTR